MKQSRGIKPIAYPRPVFIVGTYDAEGDPNMMAAAWGGICCSRPPSLCVSLRSATQSHGNIVARKAFTINIPSETYATEADYVGLISGRDVDKFVETGLTPVRAEHVDAPYVAEYPVVIECALTHTVEVGLHTLFVGEVRDVKADEACFDDQGRLDVTKIRPLIWAPDDRGYYGIGEKLGEAFTIGRALMDDEAKG
jgi:flavin reductase (DIM6/NTAB) family NADH-FMN oxidoreductase RutF